jgi:hypothetical protein
MRKEKKFVIVFMIMFLILNEDMQLLKKIENKGSLMKNMKKFSIVFMIMCEILENDMQLLKKVEE